MENDTPRRMPDNIPPFVKFCCANVPAVFDDSLSYYEALCALWKYLQDCIDVINNNALLEEEFIDKFNELEDYVEHYFDNLDVQDEINHKLDEMVEDGTIKSILNNELLGEINAKVLQNTLDISANTEALEGKISEGQAGSVTMSMLTQDVREAMTGGSTAVVAEDGIDTVNIVDKAITLLKLDDYLQSTKIVDAGTEMELGVASGGIARKNADTGKVEINAPTSTAYSWYKVNLTKGKYYYFSGLNYGPVGFIIADASDNVLYWSSEGWEGYTTIPFSLLFRANQSGLVAYIDIKNDVYLPAYRSVLRANTPSLRQVDNLYNTITKVSANLIKTLESSYLSVSRVSGSDNTLPVYNNYDNPLVPINCKFYQMSKGVKYHVSAYAWSHVQGIYLLALDNTVLYASQNENVGDNYVLNDYTFTASQDGYIVVHDISGRIPTVEVVQPFSETAGGGDETLSFDKWYALGDSLTEVNFRASENYVGYITDELGITSVNLGHSGAGYKKINTNNKTIITEVGEISGYNYNTDVITVMGSINDFSYIANDLGQLGDTTTDTIYGAMYTFFSTLQAAYMGTRIGVITPPVIGTSYNSQRDNFAKYNKALKETAELFGVPVLDLTYSCNLKPWEANFRNEFYSADGVGGSGQVDNVHPNSKGHWLIHSKIKEFLKTL